MVFLLQRLGQVAHCECPHRDILRGMLVDERDVVMGLVCTSPGKADGLSFFLKLGRVLLQVIGLRWCRHFSEGSSSMSGQCLYSILVVGVGPL